MIQLDLFEKDQLALFLEEVRKIGESSDKVRKGVYREVSTVKEEINNVKEEVNCLKQLVSQFMK